jgi:hypothetical protein
MLDHLERNHPGKPTMRELVEALVIPVANHVRSNPNGLTYLVLNRALISSSEHRTLSWRRVNDLPEVLRLQGLMREVMAPHGKDILQAKMILIQCMLFNGLARFYDLQPKGGSRAFVDTLCTGIAAVLMENPE